MHALTVKKRLRAVASVLAALKIDASIDEEVAKLVKLGGESIEVAALVGLVREKPAWLLAAKWKEEYVLRRKIELAGLTWDRFFELLPRLVIANEHVCDYIPFETPEPVCHD